MDATPAVNNHFGGRRTRPFDSGIKLNLKLFSFIREYNERLPIYPQYRASRLLKAYETRPRTTVAKGREADTELSESRDQHKSNE
jgi:hypothetical protein